MATVIDAITYISRCVTHKPRASIHIDRFLFSPCYTVVALFHQYWICRKAVSLKVCLSIMHGMFRPLPKLASALPAQQCALWYVNGMLGAVSCFFQNWLSTDVGVPLIGGHLNVVPVAIATLSYVLFVGHLNVFGRRLHPLCFSCLIWSPLNLSKNRWHARRPYP